MGEQILHLDPSQRSTDTLEFQTALRAKIVGQEEGVQALVDLYQVFCAGLNSPGRPVGNLLFLGPTGSGKTRIVEAAAEIQAARLSSSPDSRPGVSAVDAITKLDLHPRRPSVLLLRAPALS